ncbi:hypothetical protein HT105_22840 [Bacteroides fragilis]|nr:hypothetical protein [Bacteroides fragilis]
MAKALETAKREEQEAGRGTTYLLAVLCKQERDFDTVFLGILSGALLVYMALMAALWFR